MWAKRAPELGHYAQKLSCWLMLFVFDNRSKRHMPCWYLAVCAFQTRSHKNWRHDPPPIPVSSPCLTWVGWMLLATQGCKPGKDTGGDLSDGRWLIGGCRLVSFFQFMGNGIYFDDTPASCGFLQGFLASATFPWCNVHVHFDCAGSHKVCFLVSGPVFLLNIILLNISIFLLLLNIRIIIFLSSSPLPLPSPSPSSSSSTTSSSSSSAFIIIHHHPSSSITTIIHHHPSSSSSPSSSFIIIIIIITIIIILIIINNIAIHTLSFYSPPHCLGSLSGIIYIYIIYILYIYICVCVCVFLFGRI